MKMIRNHLAAIGAMLLASVTAEASFQQIQVTGLDLNYSEATGLLCDSGGGVGCSTTADALSTMTFRIDGNLAGQYTSNIGFNILLYLPLHTDPTVTATTNLLSVANDVFDAQIGGIPGLFTDVSSGSIMFSNGSVSGTGISTTFGVPNLPFGLVASDPIHWSFSSAQGACTGAAGSHICSYTGTGELSWTTANVPEPSTLVLAGSALVGLTAIRRRRRT